MNESVEVLQNITFTMWSSLMMPVLIEKSVSLNEIILNVCSGPEEIPTMLMRLWPKARTSSWVRLVKAPPCRAWLVKRLWSSSKVWRKGRVLKDWSPSTEIRLWLRPDRQTDRQTDRHIFSSYLQPIKCMESIYFVTTFKFKLFFVTEGNLCCSKYEAHRYK